MMKWQAPLAGQVCAIAAERVGGHLSWGTLGRVRAAGVKRWGRVAEQLARPDCAHAQQPLRLRDRSRGAHRGERGRAVAKRPRAGGGEEDVDEERVPRARRGERELERAVPRPHLAPARPAAEEAARTKVVVDDPACAHERRDHTRDVRELCGERRGDEHARAAAPLVWVRRCTRSVAVSCILIC
eukprot:scaffold4613_cov129-Isochrysis_galbana.AAC.6